MSVQAEYEYRNVSDNDDISNSDNDENSRPKGLFTPNISLDIWKEYIDFSYTIHIEHQC